jgi:DNA-binding SARP family transcriptional activator/tetratricopeptide (TPR) repeat protein
MRFGILGPLRALTDDGELNVGGTIQQRILAALLLSPNRVVPFARLVEIGWPDEPPHASRRLVQNRVAALRAVLTRAGAVIESHDSGYRLRVRPDELDRLLFDDLVERGRAAGSAQLLREALSLWRGPALAGLAGTPLSRDAAELEEKRLVVLEECVELELAAGAHDRLVAELAVLVDEHPLRERLVGQLITALYRCGRQTEALDAYRSLADRLSDELGIDPGAELRRLHQAVLHKDPSLGLAIGAAPAAGDGMPSLTPSQLPSDVYGFTGRRTDLARLDQLRSDGVTRPVAVISAIAGTAGVGKTALAVHWSHRVRDEFPDGQLYINLYGYSPMPAVRPIDALSRLLRALGVPAERVPTEVPEATEMYRQLLADRRVLVLLDNAGSAAQVRPLLPPASGSLALVTSRNTLAELAAQDGAEQITLGVLTPDEARALLVRLLGDDRIAAEPAPAAELARLCSYLPLALRIAVANIGDDAIAAYTANLTAGNRLAALAVEDDPQSAVRAVFDLSYTALSQPAQRMFRLLGLVPGSDFSAAVASNVADLPLADAERLLDELCAAHLLNREAGRYSFHDLLRLHAADHAMAEEDEPGRAAVTGRLYDFYLHTARAAVEHLYPGIVHLPLPDWTTRTARPLAFADRTQAMEWLDVERHNLVVTVKHAAEQGSRAAAWRLASAFGIDLRRRGYWAEGVEVASAGLAAAVADNEPHPQGVLHHGMSELLIIKSRYTAAIEHLTRLLDISRQTDWAEGISTALSQLAIVQSNIGRPAEALRYIAEAIDLDRRLDWTLGLAVDLQTLALVHWELGRLDEAAADNEEALALADGVDSSELTCISHGNLAEVYAGQGRIADAREHLERAVNMSREFGDRSVEADFLGSLAAVERLVGNRGRAFELAHAANALAQELGTTRYELRALNVLASLNDDLGRQPVAIQHSQTALRVADASADRYPYVQALIGLGAAHCHQGQYDNARAWIDKAIAESELSGYRMLLGLARTVLAEIELGHGRAADAIAEAQRALAIHRETGHRPGEADVLALIGRGYGDDDPEQAERYAREAYARYAEMGIPIPGRVRALARQHAA